MKSTMKIMLALMAGAVVAISCSKEMEFDENPIVEEPILSFLAGTEGDATKTFIDGLDVKWSANDAIAILDGTHAGKYTLTTGAGTTSGTFEFAEGEAVTAGTTVYAVYPYNVASVIVTYEYISEHLGSTYADVAEQYKAAAEFYIDYYQMEPEEVYAMFENSLSELPGADIILAYIKGVPYESRPSVGNDIISNISIPVNQVVADGEYVDPSTMLMVAQSNDGTTLNFKNVCAYVKITLVNPCMMVSVTSRGGEYVAGNYSVNLSDSSPVINCENGSDTVTLTAAEGNLAAGTYYIAVGVSALQNGLSIKYFNTTDGCFKARILTTSFEFARNKVYNGGKDTDASVDGALWSIAFSDEERTVIEENIKKIVFDTKVPLASKPAGAKILGVGTSIWSYMDSDNVLHIQTPAPKIWGRERIMYFDSFRKVQEYEGLAKLDVTEVHDLYRLFWENCDLKTLDLSSWNFVRITSAYGTFTQNHSLASLKLNDTFDISGVSNLQYIVHNIGFLSVISKCVISGITNVDIKNAFKDRYGRETGWRDEIVMFKVEE